MSINLKSPSVQRAALGLMASLGAIGLFFFSSLLPFGYKQKKDEITKIKAEYEKRSAELAQARATVADLPRFEAEYTRVHSQWAHAAQLVPTENRLPTLLRQITLAAQQNGIGMAVVRPGEPKNEQHYTEMPIEISVSGPYHQVASFLANIANLPRIVNVTALKLKAIEAKSDGPAGSTEAEFTASSYHLNTTANTVATPPEAPAANRNKEEEPNVHKKS